MFSVARKLKQMGVIGLNKRNADVILPLNPRRLYPLVDDKITTKKMAEAAGLGVPKLYGTIEYSAQVRTFARLVQPYENFVIKPANGAGGDGIVVVKGRSGDLYRRANGTLVSQFVLRSHIQNALGGAFSLGGQPDTVLIEYCVEFDPVFEKIAYQGVPDIRVIVYKGVPIMAMVRLPTRASDGRANLHQGALGAGIDMAEGKTLGAVFNNKIVNEHPDTLASITDVPIPSWQKILEIAAQTHELTGLGYVGVDIVLDRDFGPLILELNARPGLNIQIANRVGLQPRIDAAESWLSEPRTLEQRVKFARENLVGI